MRGVPRHPFAHRGEDAPPSGFVGRGGGLLVVCCLFCGSVEVKVHKRPRSVWLVVSRPRVTGPLEQGVPTRAGGTCTNTKTELWDGRRAADMQPPGPGIFLSRFGSSTCRVAGAGGCGECGHRTEHATFACNCAASFRGGSLFQGLAPFFGPT